MRSKQSYIPQQYTNSLLLQSSKSKLSPTIQLRKKSRSKLNKESPKAKIFRTDSITKQSFESPLQSSRQNPSHTEKSRFRSITRNSKAKQQIQKQNERQKPRSKSKIRSKIKSKVFKSSGNAQKLAKQNIKLKKALKQSEQEKLMLSQKLQFFKSNMKSSPKQEYLPKLNQLTNLVKSLKKTYQQDEMISRLPTHSAFKSKNTKQEANSQTLKKEESRSKLESIIKTIQHGLKQIQGHKQMFQNFTNSK